MNYILLWLRNQWILLSLRFYKHPIKNDTYCLVAGSQAPINAYALFHWDEAFVSPCTFNEINCGGFVGRWTPKIQMIGLELGNDD